MELKRVHVNGGVYGVYDHGGRFVGTVNAETGRAMIGDAFWQRVDGGFVDRARLLEIADDMGEYSTGTVESALVALREYADEIRVALEVF